MTRNDLAPAFGDGCEEGNEPEYEDALEYPGYLASAATEARDDIRSLSVKRAKDIFRGLWWEI